MRKYILFILLVVLVSLPAAAQIKYFYADRVSDADGNHAFVVNSIIAINGEVKTITLYDTYTDFVDGVPAKIITYESYGYDYGKKTGRYQFCHGVDGLGKKMFFAYFISKTDNREYIMLEDTEVENSALLFRKAIFKDDTPKVTKKRRK